MTLKKNRAFTNENVSPKKFIRDANSKDLARKQAQAINSTNTNFDPINKISNFDFTDSKMEKQFNFNYHHWGARTKVTPTINKRKKSPEILRLWERLQEITKPGDVGFNFHSKLNQKVSVPRQPKKRGRDEVAAIDQELLFRNNGKNRWGGGYFEFNKPKANSSTEQKITNPAEQNKVGAEPVSSTEDSEVAKLSSNFPIVNLKDYDIAKRTLYYFQVSDMLGKPKKKSVEAQQTLKEAEFNFFIDLQTLIHKTSVDRD